MTTCIKHLMVCFLLLNTDYMYDVAFMQQYSILAIIWYSGHMLIFCTTALLLVWMWNGLKLSQVKWTKMRFESSFKPRDSVNTKRAGFFITHFTNGDKFAYFKMLSR